MPVGKSNYGKIKERYVAHQQSAAEQQGYWKPVPGRHKLRLLPPPVGRDAWFVDYAVHYGIVNQETGEEMAITCPKFTVKKACPICEFCNQLFRGKDPADEKMAKKLYRKMRYVSNVVVLSQDPKEAKSWSYGPQIWTQINELSVGDESGGVLPVDDPQAGYNLVMTVTTKQTPEGNFPQYMVKLDGAPPKPMSLPDMSVLDKIKDHAVTIHQSVKSYEEIKSILLGSDDSTGSTAKTTAPKAAAKTVTEVPGTNEVIESDEPPAEEEPVAEDPAGEGAVVTETKPEETPNAKEEKPAAQQSSAPARSAPSDLVAKARAIAAKQRR